MKVRIVNVVATSDLGQQIDLDLVKQLPWSERPTFLRGKGAYFKKIRMQGRVIVFGSGKMISVGTRSEGQARRELRETLDTLVSEGLAHNVSLRVNVQNVVASANFGRPIDLEKLAKSVRDVVYEPEQFPNLMLLISKAPRVNVSISHKGTYMITGAKSSVSAMQIARDVDSILTEFGRAD